MKKHIHNFGLMLVLAGLLIVPIVGYGLLMSYESNEDVLSEVDIREVEETYNYEFKKINLEVEEDEETEKEFDPASYAPAEADLYLD